MRYQLDTIPVWDACKLGSECPLCTLRARNEDAYADGFLGDSVMDPATRVLVNERGFCNRHFAMMLPMKNRLGLALNTHTYLKNVMADAQKILDEAAKSDAPSLLSGLRRLSDSTETSPATKLRARVGNCILCERLDFTMRRYAYTLVHLWQNDLDFRKLFNDSKGLCLPDTALVMEMADAAIRGSKRREFFSALATLQKENLSRIEQELEWFTLKFDYRNRDKPWGESRDALERAIGKLSGDRPV
ncbi:MAG: DUF6062 family protein [Clostridia bacterium]|nr:DUF6062 family protein [Clostridia bacterium]